MALPPLELDPAQLLAGSWRVQATNLPVWLSGERLNPRISYAVTSTHPLILGDDVASETPEGEEKRNSGTNRHNNGVFTWRANGFFTMSKCRWSIAGASDDHTVVAIRFDRSRVRPEGINILVRDGIDRPELRSLVAHNAEGFGLTAEDFASLTWLRLDDPAPLPGTA